MGGLMVGKAITDKGGKAEKSGQGSRKGSGKAHKAKSGDKPKQAGKAKHGDKPKESKPGKPAGAPQESFAPSAALGEGMSPLLPVTQQLLQGLLGNFGGLGG